MLEDFKKFALKGNVLDLAIAVVIGAAFGKIVTSLVEDIIMPAVGILLGGFSVEDWTYTFNGAVLCCATVHLFNRSSISRSSRSRFSWSSGFSQR